MSDTIRTYKRQTSTALDQDFILIALNTQMIDDIKQSCIKEFFYQWISKDQCIQTVFMLTS